MEQFNAVSASLECYGFGTEDRIQVFRPTMEEFSDFEMYIHYMEEKGAHKAGIAKVIPPKEWTPRVGGYSGLEEFKITSPVEQLLVGSSGVYQLCNVEKRDISLRQYINMANSKQFEPPSSAASFDEIERNYWRSLHCFHPLYGADVPGTLTDASQTVWNIATLPSILRQIFEENDFHIAGVNTPYLYFGMWKTTFPWHTEDADLYSINYLHFGAPKFWYSVPPASGLRLERVAQGYFQGIYKQCRAFLRHKTTVLSPTLLHNYSVPYNKMIQFPGEFIVTFPYGYHAGFNCGFNCAESTNFALPRWIDYGKYCSTCECMPDAVKIDMDLFVRRYQPDRYEAWRSGTEKAAHPEGAAAGQVHIRTSAPSPPPLGVIATTISLSSKSPMTKTMRGRSQDGRQVSKKSEDKKRRRMAKSCQDDSQLDSPDNGNLPKLSLQRSDTSEQSGKLNPSIHNSENETSASEPPKVIKLPSGISLKLIPVLPCSCGRCFPLSESNKNMTELDMSELRLQTGETMGPLAAALSPLFIWQSFSFSAERAFNHFMSRRAPHCAICQLFVPDSPVIYGPCPPRSLPLIPELAFAMRTNTRSRDITTPPDESMLLHCRDCSLVVHAFCYGAEEPSPSRNSPPSWCCERCMSGKIYTHCSLCVMRGGALKPTTSGKWAHILCALFTEGSSFESDLSRGPIREPSFDQTEQTPPRCNICLRSDGAMAHCTVEEACRSQSHVTCGAFFGVLLVVDNWPDPVSIVCLHRHNSRRETILSGCNTPCPEVGDPILFIKGNSKTARSFSEAKRLEPGVVTARSETTRLQVRFEESATACNNLDLADVIDPPAGEVVPQSYITVRWRASAGSEASSFRAYCLGITRKYSFDLKLDDGSDVKNVSLGQIVPFFLKTYDPLYFSVR